MAEPEKKTSENAELQILVLDLDTLDCEETLASGFCKKGCRVQSSRLTYLGKTVGIRRAGFDRMIRGRVEKIEDGEVYVSFQFADTPQQEKRHERRRKVFIPAWVSGRQSENGQRCDIIDASHSGCRLESAGIERLPDEIKLQIGGLDMPVNGQIVWRGSGLAGVKLTWQFSNGKEFDDKRIKPPDLAEKAGVKSKRKVDTSGFAVKRRKPAI